MKFPLIVTGLLASTFLASSTRAAPSEPDAEEIRWACYYLLVLDIPAATTLPAPCQELRDRHVDPDIDIVSKGLLLLAPDKSPPGGTLDEFLRLEPSRLHSLADKYYFHAYLARSLESRSLRSEPDKDKAALISEKFDAYLKAATALKQSDRAKLELSGLLAKYFEWLMRNNDDERAFRAWLMQEDLLSNSRLAFRALDRGTSLNYDAATLKGLARRLTDHFGVGDWRGGAVVSVLSLRAVLRSASGKPAAPGEEDLFPIFSPIWKKNGLLSKQPQVASWFIKRAILLHMNKKGREAEELVDYVYAGSKTTKLDIFEHSSLRKIIVQVKISLKKYGEAQAIDESMEAVWQKDYLPLAAQVASSNR